MTSISGALAFHSRALSISKRLLEEKNTHLGDTRSGRARAVVTIPRLHAEEALLRRGHLSYDSVSASV